MFPFSVIELFIDMENEEKEYRLIYQFNSENYNTTYQYLEKINQFLIDYFDLVFSNEVKYKKDWFVKNNTTEITLIEIVPPFAEFEYIKVNFNDFSTNNEMMVEIENLARSKSIDGSLINMAPIVFQLIHTFSC